MVRVPWRDSGKCRQYRKSFFACGVGGRRLGIEKLRGRLEVKEYAVPEKTVVDNKLRSLYDRFSDEGLLREVGLPFNPKKANDVAMDFRSALYSSEETLRKTASDLATLVSNLNSQIDSVHQQRLLMEDIPSDKATAQTLADYDALIQKETQLAQMLAVYEPKMRLHNKALETRAVVRDSFEKEPSFVIDITPELKTLVNSEGFEYYAKGGIVDIAKISAKQGAHYA